MTRRCDQCGQWFTRSGTRGRFCSLSCSGLSRRIVRQCVGCGDEFRPTHGAKAKPIDQPCCSHACASRRRAREHPEQMRQLSAAGVAKRAATYELPAHGITRYDLHGCRCDVCRAARRAANKRNRKPVAPRHGIRRHVKTGCLCPVCAAAAAKSRELKQAHWARSASRLVAETAPTAHRGGYQWTGPELEIADRRDLTAIEVARMIGRTAYAVKNMRRKLAVDPRVITLAGTREVPA